MRLILLAILVVFLMSLRSQSNGAEFVYDQFYLHKRAPLDAKFIAADTVNVTLPYEGQIVFFTILGKHMTYVSGGWKDLAAQAGSEASDFSVTESDISAVSWNTIRTPGVHPQRLRGDNANGPEVDGFYYAVNYRNGLNDDVFQKAVPVDLAGGHVYFRTFRADTWSEWYRENDGRVIGVESKDWNTITDAGLYKNIIRGDQPNGPGGGAVFFYVRNVQRGPNNFFQEALPYSGDVTLWRARTMVGGTWGAWQDVVTSQASLWTVTDVSTSQDFNSVTAPGIYGTILRGNNPNGPGPSSFYYVENTIRGNAIFQYASRYGNSTDALLYARTRATDGVTWSSWQELPDGMGNNDAGGNEVVNAADATVSTSLTTLQQVQALIGDYGVFTGTTDASGDIVISHDLGVIPDAIFVSAEGDVREAMQVRLKTSTDFTVRVFGTAGSVLSNTLIALSWNAKQSF